MEIKNELDSFSKFTKKNYIIIKTLAQFNAARKELEDATVVAYDVESTGLNVRKDTIIGFSFSTKVGTGYYLPLWYWDTTQMELVPFNIVLLQEGHITLLNILKQKLLVMHNASYDIRITMSNFGISLLNSLLADTMLMEHTINESGPFGLKDIAAFRIGQLKLDDQEFANQEQMDLGDSVKRNGGKWLKTNKEIYRGDLDLVAKYAIADTDLTLRLFYHHHFNLIKENLYDYFYDEEVMPLYKLVTIRMEHRGVYLDMSKLRALKAQIQEDIIKYEEIVVIALMATSEGMQFIKDRLNEDFPAKNAGSFAQGVAQFFDLPLPKNEKGKYSITKKTISKAFGEVDSVDQGRALEFLDGIEGNLFSDEIEQIQKRLYIKKHDTPHLINISSKAQLGKIVFDLMGIDSLTKTPGGSGQFNETFVEHLAEEYGFEWAKELRVYNKLIKIDGSYFDRFIEEQEDGIFYPSFKQHGTTSGRYSSDLQQLPRPKDEDSVEHPLVKHYNDSIRELFIPKPGYVYIDDDYESLEPRVFADDAGDEALIKIFTDNLDMYSVVAIMAENITDASADKKAPNFLKKLYPMKRQNAKAYALGIRYGMKDGKLSMSLNISKEEAQNIIDNYFKAFPKLKAKMDSYLLEAKTKGTVTSKFGRVRHLSRIKEIYDNFGDDILEFKNLKKLSFKTYTPYATLMEIRKEYNNLLNNALNFPIQSAATSIVNRAAVAMTTQFIAEGLDAWVSLQIHDQIVATCNNNCIDRVKEIVQDCMENTNLLLMPLIAKPEVAHNLREGH